jgi:hypothetical protein
MSVGIHHRWHDHGRGRRIDPFFKGLIWALALSAMIWAVSLGAIYWAMHL